LTRTESSEPRPVRRKLFLSAVCAFALLGFAPVAHAASKHRLGSEAAAATNVSVTLVDGNQTSEVLPGTPQEAPPGSAVALRVTATLASGETWRRTSYQLGNGPVVCVDTTDMSGAGARTVFVNPARVTSGANRTGGGVTLPEAAGPGSVTVTLWSNPTTCSVQLTGGTATGGFTILPVTANPGFTPDCETRLVLVLDESGSIDTAGATETVRNGARTFMRGLIGSGVQVAVIEFNSLARTVRFNNSVYNTVNADFVDGPFERYISGVGGAGTDQSFNPSTWTNWSDAFTRVGELSPQPQLVVFVTDGDPTARTVSGTAQTGYPDGSYIWLKPAFDQANALKTPPGPHLFVLGVGEGLTSASSQIRLRAISGPNRYSAAHAFADSDYLLLTDFHELETALSQISTAVCSVRVQVTKLVDEDANGTYVPQNSWNFDGTVTVSGGSPDSYRWLTPGTQVGPPSGGNTRTGTTATTLGEDGRTSFAWLPSPSTLSSTIELTDTGRTDYHFVSVSCAENGTDLPVPNEPTITLTGLAINADVSCVFKNQRDTGQLRVRKVFVGPPTRVSLRINGDTKITDDSQTFETRLVTVPARRHQVDENFVNPATAVLYRSSYVCRDQHDRIIRRGRGAVVARGVPVRNGDVITCTFTNEHDISLGVAKVADPTFVDEPGGEVKFTVAVHNPTPGPVTLTRLTDSVFGNLDAGAPASERSWITSDCVTGGTIEPGDTFTCHFVGRVTVTPDKPHEDTVTARITDLVGASRDEDADATVNGNDLLPSIRVEKTADPFCSTHRAT
jgi:hypothetical protein